jgi:hypothetical protein
MICKVTKETTGLYVIFINHFKRFIIKKTAKRSYCTGNYFWEVENLNTKELLDNFISLKEAKEFCLSIVANEGEKHVG